MKNHKIRTDPATFQSIAWGSKKADIVPNSSNINGGDNIIYMEYHYYPSDVEGHGKFTGRCIKKMVTHVQTELPIYISEDLRNKYRIISLDSKFAVFEVIEPEKYFFE